MKVEIEQFTGKDWIILAKVEAKSEQALDDIFKSITEEEGVQYFIGATNTGSGYMGCTLDKDYGPIRAHIIED